MLNPEHIELKDIPVTLTVPLPRPNEPRCPAAFDNLAGYDKPDSAPRIRWPERMGLAHMHNVADLGWARRELVFHWSEVRTPAGQSQAFYDGQIASMAHYHAFDRNWGTPAAPVKGWGLMYHFVVTPPDSHGVAWLIQCNPLTLDLWHAHEANGHALGVCVMLGHDQVVTPEQETVIRQTADWLCCGRPDLKGITPWPGTVDDGLGHRLQTFGVTTHDEVNVRLGHPTKGCPGPVQAIITDWRNAHPGGRCHG